MKKILETILQTLSKAILKKYKPNVIAITGSVGKTTTKEAIATVLGSTYSVRATDKNYNNEIGVPLTIIGADTGGRSVIKWAGVFVKAIILITVKNKNYPDILIIEMGADRPGDIAKLCALAPVDTGVVTEVSEAHTEFLGNLEDVAEEKGSLIKSLNTHGQAVLNYDNKFVHKMEALTDANVVFYGMSSEADVAAKDISTSIDDGKLVTSFKIDFQNEEHEIIIPNVLGEHLIYSILAAISVGHIYDLDIITIIKSLSDINLPAGRMRLIDGIKNTLLIDDTYNSSPLAAQKAALELVKLKTSAKKYAVLGDMLELGHLSEEAHYNLGRLVALQNIDYLITVGELSRDIVRGALEANMSQDNCFNFADSLEAGRFLQKRIKENDILLIKGSQGVRMEFVVKELMARPERAKDLLVRQEDTWIK